MQDLISAILCYGRLIISLPYQLGHLAHKALYKIGLLKAHRLPRPVISIGNISFGGSGKTPFTIMLADYLSSQGLRVGILSRAYGSRASSSGRIVIISPSELAEHDVREIGDEPYLILQQLQQSKNPDYNNIIIGGNRFRAGIQALTIKDIDVFILDDAMQHLALHKDLEIVLVNIHETGFMREFPSALGGADILIYTKVDEDWIQQNNLRSEPQAYLRYRLSLRSPLDPNKDICLITAIADPETLFKQFKTQLPDLVAQQSSAGEPYKEPRLCLKSFPDHHYFSLAEVNQLKSLGMNLVCTLKDFVKIPESSRNSFIPLDLSLELQPQDLLSRIKGKLSNG